MRRSAKRSIECSVRRRACCFRASATPFVVSINGFFAASHVRIVGRFRSRADIGQRLKAGFNNGDLSTGAAFRFIGQVEVFELGLT